MPGEYQPEIPYEYNNLSQNINQLVNDESDIFIYEEEALILEKQIEIVDKDLAKNDEVCPTQAIFVNDEFNESGKIYLQQNINQTKDSVIIN